MVRRRSATLTQDACAFYKDHALFDPFSGVVLDQNEGKKIALALGSKKAAILQNHGLSRLVDYRSTVAFLHRDSPFAKSIAPERAALQSAISAR